MEDKEIVYRLVYKTIKAGHEVTIREEILPWLSPLSEELHYSGKSAFTDLEVVIIEAEKLKEKFKKRIHQLVFSE